MKQDQAGVVSGEGTSFIKSDDQQKHSCTFQVCIETWDPLDKEGADASTSFKEAVGWTGSLFTSETGAAHEDRQIARSREKLQLEWIPMHKEKEFFDVSIADDSSSIRKPLEFKLIGTIKGGAVDSSGVIGVPIMQVAVLQ